MPCIKPFKAIRPIPELAERVAALPYDVMDGQEARQMVADNPHSFLKIARAEVDFEPGIDVYSQQIYQQACENLKHLISTGVLVKDPVQNFYLYKLSSGDHSQTGLVASTSVDDYLEGNIKKHEHTRPDKQQDRMTHIKTCNAQAEPILLTYQECDGISVLISSWLKNNKPIYDFTASDGIRHEVWIIDDENTKDQLIDAFGSIDALYIADGHHRCAAATGFALQQRKQNPRYTGLEAYNYILSVLFPHNHLRIMDYNRVVRDLNSHSPAEFMVKVSQQFQVEQCADNKQYSPNSPQYFGMYLQGAWYKLKFIGQVPADPVQGLDVSILQDNLLDPILGISNPRTDSRIDFIGGIRGLGALEAKVDSGEMAVAFSLCPTTVADVMAVADMGMVMPPKSTWFEPKLRSGLFIHSFK